jgi:siroheme synthase
MAGLARGVDPGDPDLITLRGRRAIQAVDVVLYDSLVGPRPVASILPSVGWGETLRAGLDASVTVASSVPDAFDTRAGGAASIRSHGLQRGIGLA